MDIGKDVKKVRARYELTCPELEFYKVRPLVAGYN